MPSSSKWFCPSGSPTKTLPTFCVRIIILDLMISTNHEAPQFALFSSSSCSLPSLSATFSNTLVPLTWHIHQMSRHTSHAPVTPYAVGYQRKKQEIRTCVPKILPFVRRLTLPQRRLWRLQRHMSRRHFWICGWWGSREAGASAAGRRHGVGSWNRNRHETAEVSSIIGSFVRVLRHRTHWLRRPVNVRVLQHRTHWLSRSVNVRVLWHRTHWLSRSVNVPVLWHRTHWLSRSANVRVLWHRTHWLSSMMQCSETWRRVVGLAATDVSRDPNSLNKAAEYPPKRR